MASFWREVDVDAAVDGGGGAVAAARQMLQAGPRAAAAFGQPTNSNGRSRGERPTRENNSDSDNTTYVVWNE